MTPDAPAGWISDDPRVAEIVEIVAKETGIEPARLTPDASIASLEIASLDMVQAIFAIESRFDVEIPLAVERQGGEFATIGDFVTHVLASMRGS